jgi:hypothetical protein
LWEERRLRVFENRVLRRIFVSKRDDITEEWRKIHNEGLNVLYFSPNNFRMIKSRIIGWARHVACVGRREVNIGLCWGNLRERDRLGDPGVDGRIILRWIFRKRDMGGWTGSNWLRIGTGGGHL